MIDRLKSTVEATLLYPQAVIGLGKRAVARLITGLEKIDEDSANLINAPEDEDELHN